MQRNNWKCTTNPETIASAIKPQVGVEAGLSPISVQSLLPTVAQGEDVLDTAVSTAHIELNKSSRTTFADLFDAIKAVRDRHDTDFRQPTKSHEKKTGESLFGDVILVLTDPLYNV